MSDLPPLWIKIKGLLFLLTGFTAGGLLLLEQPTIRTSLLLAVTVWSFCRAYYCAFYVIEHYVDPTYKFAGLVDFAKYFLLGRRNS